MAVAISVRTELRAEAPADDGRADVQIGEPATVRHRGALADAESRGSRLTAESGPAGFQRQSRNHHRIAASDLCVLLSTRSGQAVALRCTSGAGLRILHKSSREPQRLRGHRGSTEKARTETGACALMQTCGCRRDLRSAGAGPGEKSRPKSSPLCAHECVRRVPSFRWLLCAASVPAHFGLSLCGSLAE
jgi:hypothetical protein